MVLHDLRDQRDRPWRPFAEAMITDEALFRLAIDPRTYAGKAFGLASRAIVEQEFSWDAAGRATIAMYKELLA